MKAMRIPFLLAAVLAASATLSANIVVDFEGLPDSTVLTNQYPGLSFSNAIILSAGISLNEFEFPPHSGVNVASDNGGPMSIMFSTPIFNFGGYFTYAEPLSIEAFGAGNTLLAAATSLFSNNEALSGDPGSGPNEFLQVSSISGISSITVTGDPAGGSFALDDATYNTTPAAVPEPSTWSLLFSATAFLALLRRRKLP